MKQCTHSQPLPNNYRPPSGDHLMPTTNQTQLLILKNILKTELLDFNGNICVEGCIEIQYCCWDEWIKKILQNCRWNAARKTSLCRNGLNTSQSEEVWILALYFYHCPTLNGTTLSCISLKGADCSGIWDLLIYGQPAVVMLKQGNTMIGLGSDD